MNFHLSKKGNLLCPLEESFSSFFPTFSKVWIDEFYKTVQGGTPLGGPVAETLISQCWGPGFDPWLGN